MRAIFNNYKCALQLSAVLAGSRRKSFAAANVPVETIWWLEDLVVRKLLRHHLVWLGGKRHPRPPSALGNFHFPKRKSPKCKFPKFAFAWLSEHACIFLQPRQLPRHHKSNTRESNVKVLTRAMAAPIIPPGSHTGLPFMMAQPQQYIPSSVSSA